MGYFPLCINLDHAPVVLVGEGKMTREKLNILISFHAQIRLFSLHGFDDMKEHPQICLLRRQLLPEDLLCRPTLIVIGDTEDEEKKRISLMAQERNIPVNVVDVPALCTFYFPALITNGALTVAVSTGGKSPGAAAYLKRQLEQYVPDNSGEILEWAQEIRKTLKKELPKAMQRRVLGQVIAKAFEQNRPLTGEEIGDIIAEHSFYSSANTQEQVPY